MSRKNVLKIASGFSFIAGIILLAESGAIDLDLRSLDLGGLAILAGGLALGVVIVLRFFDTNYDDDGNYIDRNGKDRDSRK